MGFLLSLSSLTASYSHVFLSQLEKAISSKDHISPSEISAILTMVVSASFLGEVIGTGFATQDPSSTSLSPTSMEKEEP